MRIYFFAICCVFCVSCATKTLYTWGNYDSSLYHYYKNPEKADDYEQTLQKIIADGEDKQNVAPGIYAEYGYLLLQKKDYANAKMYFAKEKELWPESAKMMDDLMSKIDSMDGNKQEPTS